MAEKLVKRLEMVLTQLIERDICAAAPKAVFFLEEIRWCSNLYSGEEMQHYPDGVQG